MGSGNKKKMPTLKAKWDRRAQTFVCKCPECPQLGMSPYAFKAVDAVREHGGRSHNWKTQVY